MESRTLPAILALGATVLAVVLLIVLRGSDDAGEPAPAGDVVRTDPAQLRPEPSGGPAPKPERPAKQEIASIEVRSGEPVGGAQDLEFPSGGEILVEVSADAADELHLHGYDVYTDLEAGKLALLRVPADIEGLFELESHTTGVLLAEISVVPG